MKLWSYVKYKLGQDNDRSWKNLLPPTIVIAKGAILLLLPMHLGGMIGFIGLILGVLMCFLGLFWFINDCIEISSGYHPMPLSRHIFAAIKEYQDWDDQGEA